MWQGIVILISAAVLARAWQEWRRAKVVTHTPRAAEDIPIEYGGPHV